MARRIPAPQGYQAVKLADNEWVAVEAVRDGSGRLSGVNLLATPQGELVVERTRKMLMFALQIAILHHEVSELRRAG